jgi:hypothetical protein
MSAGNVFQPPYGPRTRRLLDLLLRIARRT